MRGACALTVAAIVVSSCSQQSLRASSQSNKTMNHLHKGGHATTEANRSGTSSTNRRSPSVPAFRHIFLVVMENLGYNAAMKVPALARLAHRYASATQYYAVAHPSLPNYIALTSGSTSGIHSDCTSCRVSAMNLGTQLSAAHLSWNAYMEGLPGPCFLGPYAPAGDYAGKHNPFRYFTQIRSSPSACSHIQPLSKLEQALQSRTSSVPRFSWITPDMCNDGHDCSAQTAGQWLDGLVKKITSSNAYRNGGVIFITWDEGSFGDTRGVSPAGTGAVLNGSGGGHVLTLVIAAGLSAGLKVATHYDHYSILATVEDAFRLPLLANAAARGTRPMSAFWSTSKTQRP